MIDANRKALLAEGLSTKRADELGLVLSSMGIGYRRGRGPSGWNLAVAEKDRETATQILQKYHDENQKPAHREEIVWRKTSAGFWICIVLIAFHAATGKDSHAFFVKSFGADAQAIMKGEIFRAVTALFLHGDDAHLAGNIGGMFVFGTAVCSLVGWGAGWLLILASGIAGNLVNAVVHQTAHISIGASTSVFGAIGILSGIRMRENLPDRRYRAFLPLGAGIALLAFLGAGAHTDLSAHLFGFSAGIGMGIGAFFLVKKAGEIQTQILFSLLSILVIGLCWFWGGRLSF